MSLISLAIFPARSTSMMRQGPFSTIMTRPSGSGWQACTSVFSAALSFGFWIHVLKPEFHRLIWREHLRRAFPNLPREISGKDLHQKLDDIGSLRNRIAHHEPLLRADHSRLHSDIVGVIGFVCAQTAAWARAHSKVPTILRSRP